MRKAILVMTSNVVNAITEDNIQYNQVLNIEDKNISYLDNEFKFFNENEKEIFNNLKSLEFKNAPYGWFSKGSGHYIRLMEGLSDFNFNANDMDLDKLINFWGSLLYTGMGTYAVGLRVQYIKIKKPVVKRTLKVFDEEEDWTFTFSTYKDDLNSLAYEKSLSRLNERYKEFDLKTEYSNDDLVKMTDMFIKDNPQLISAKNKIERNMLDYKNKRSVYVRLDKDFITDEDINYIIEKFKTQNYMIFQ